MTWLVPKLKERVQIRKAIGTPNDSAGFDRSYITLVTIWGAFKPLEIGSFLRQRHIRGLNVNDEVTHVFKFRRTALRTQGKAFTSSFSTAFNSIEDLNILKSDHFLFVQRGNTTKGRLFRIIFTQDDKENREFINVLAEEIEEQGSGYPS
jgi:head-tail adaptor